MSLTGLPQLGALAPRPAIGATEAELPNGDAGDAGLELALLGLGAAAPPPARATPPRSPEAFALDPNAAGLGFSPRPAISAEASAQPQPAAAPRAEGAMWWVAAMVQPAGAPPTVVPAAGGRAAAGLPPRPPSAPPAPAQLPPRAPSPGPLALAAGPALTARPGPAQGDQPAAPALAPARALAGAAAALGASPRTFDAAPWLQPAGAVPGAAHTARSAAPSAPPALALGGPGGVPSPAVAGGAEAAPVESAALPTVDAEAAPRPDAAAPAPRVAVPASPTSAPGAEARTPEAGAEAPTRALPDRPAELPARLEVLVRDSAGDIRVAVTREDSGYGVEMRAPRELVPELRALRPALESALSGEGDAEQGLASFDASADDLPRDEHGEGADAPEGSDRRPGRDAPLPLRRSARAAAPARPAPNPARLLDRRA